MLLRARRGLFLPTAALMAGAVAPSFSAPAYVDGTTESVPNFSGSSTTFTGRNVGSADSNRWIIVGVAHYAGTLTGVTVGGNTATKIGSWSLSNNNTALWIANVPSGGTADVVVSYTNNTLYSLSVVLWRMVAGGTPVANSFGQGEGPFTDSTVSPLNILTGGGAVWIGNGSDGAGNGGAVGFSGTSVVDDYSPTTGVSAAGGSRTVAGLISAVMSSNSGNYRTTAVGASFSNPSGWTNTLAPVTFTHNSGGWPGYTLRILIPAGILSQNGSQIRVTFSGGVGVTNYTEIAKAYIGPDAGGSAGSASSLTQLLFAGAASPGIIKNDSFVTSDALAFSFNEALNYYVSVYITSGGGNVPRLNAAAQTGARMYYKSGDEAATASVSGYSGDGNFIDNLGLVSKIEVA